MTSQHLLLLGTHDHYIHSAFFDETTRQLKQGPTTKTAEHPSWLTQHPSVHFPVIRLSLSLSLSLSLFIFRFGLSADIEQERERYSLLKRTCGWQSLLLKSQGGWEC